ncbi:MAG: hypothetical protein Harvfovirus35_12 [Harvfovirus sp.]|uniref:Uncharacterized protein n=1 Tax=Harvfovirus sp. TaxID=2487768 RepID=A0A3G5A6J5_9VIRU|nr:MAG: hypothetical protein Harvfovirus35_12 [Harvfovirus sp.]
MVILYSGEEQSADGSNDNFTSVATIGINIITIFLMMLLFRCFTNSQTNSCDESGFILMLSGSVIIGSTVTFLLHCGGRGCFILTSGLYIVILVEFFSCVLIGTLTILSLVFKYFFQNIYNKQIEKWMYEDVSIPESTIITIHTERKDSSFINLELSQSLP